MLRFLSIECEWIDQPAAADVLERKTWADIRIRVAGRAVTRVWDRRSLAERVSIFVPAFTLARWIVQNWWALLYEPIRSERVPQHGAISAPSHLAWLRRHCLRAAKSGLVLPRASLYSDGRGVCVTWSADEPASYPHMPAEFIEGGAVQLEREEAADGLKAFVVEVLRRINGEDDARAVQLRANWEAITTDDSEEAQFCRAAGRLGLDPYQEDAHVSELVDLIDNPPSS